jgi:hypothetical protein
METANDLLSRWFHESPRREAALPTESQSPETVPPPLDALPKHHLEGEDRKPFLTSADLRKVNDYLAVYGTGVFIIRELGLMASRPGVSLAEVKAIARLVDETSEMIRPIKPIVDAFNRFCDKQRQVVLRYREFANWLNNWTLHRKLDRLDTKLDRVMETLERKPEARMTETVSDLEAALLGRPQ